MSRDTPAFSRTGFTSPLGGMTAEIPKIKIPEVTKELLDRKAREAGLNTSEFVRKLLMLHVHGVDMLLSVERQQLDVVAGKGRDGGAGNA
jgi:hypothetical protein